MITYRSARVTTCIHSDAITSSIVNTAQAHMERCITIQQQQIHICSWLCRQGLSCHRIHIILIWRLLQKRTCLRTIWDRGWSLEMSILFVQTIHIWEEKNVGDKIVDTIVIPQNEDGIDTEDRITLLKNYIKANLSWVALQEGTVNYMFPLTSKMKDKFPLTQDINSGVSVHLVFNYRSRVCRR